MRCLKQYLGIYETKMKCDWHNYVDLAIFVHNTSYRVVIGCTPSFLFHGKQPLTPLELRFNNKLLQNLGTRFGFTQELQNRMNEVFCAARDATINAYKYRHFYYRKASMAPLEKLQYCLLLNPKLTNVNDHMKKSLTKRVPLYRVESVLTNFQQKNLYFPSENHLQKLGKRSLDPGLSASPLHLSQTFDLAHKIRNWGHKILKIPFLRRIWTFSENTPLFDCLDHFFDVFAF